MMMIRTDTAEGNKLLTRKARGGQARGAEARMRDTAPNRTRRVALGGSRKRTAKGGAEVAIGGGIGGAGAEERWRRGQKRREATLVGC